MGDYDDDLDSLGVGGMLCPGITDSDICNALDVTLGISIRGQAVCRVVFPETGSDAALLDRSVDQSKDFLPLKDVVIQLFLTDERIKKTSAPASPPPDNSHEKHPKDKHHKDKDAKPEEPEKPVAQTKTDAQGRFN